MTAAVLDDLLRNGAQEMGLPLDSVQRELLLKYIAELADWNTRINLTAIRDPEDMVRKHLLDSLSIQPYLHGQTIADIGSGAGLPAIPLAILNPSRRFFPVESITKKARFISHAVEALGLTNVEVVNARAEAWKPAQRCDTVTARALSSLADFVRFAGHLCAPDGCLLAMKGQHPREEIDALPKSWKVAAVHPLKVPGLDAERHLVELRRRA